MSKANKIHTAVYTALGIIIIICAVMWYRCAQREKQMTTAVNNNYDRAFFELTDYVTDIDALLSKAQLASSPAQLAAISNEIFMQAAEAKSCFGELPSQEVNLERTAQFLSQVGDYTYVLSQNMINGGTISQQEYETLNKLNGYAANLSKTLNGIEEKINNGEITFNTADGSLIKTVFASNDILQDLENVEKSFEGYPSLIYDGPFSEHIENQQSVKLHNAQEINSSAALQIARDFTGIDDLKYESEMLNTAIEAYIFSRNTQQEQVTVSITKKGGYVLYFLKNREVKERNYDPPAAIETAMKYLEEKGFYGFVDSYYEVSNNVATINFAYSKDNIKYYSDLIKVRVALDNGEITGLECKGYLMNNKERDTSNIVLTENEAREKVSTHLDVTAVSLAMIPKDSLREVLCYEFKGTYRDKNFIVYVNAENGREEDILILIESPEGILTI